MSETRSNKKSEDPHVTGKPVIIPDTPPAPTHEQIAAVAYDLWVERGCPHGSHEEDWNHAEEQLREDQKALTKSAGA